VIKINTKCVYCPWCNWNDINIKRYLENIQIIVHYKSKSSIGQEKLDQRETVEYLKINDYENATYEFFS
jgi:hypothetical protein